jgi:hypothetical protein
MENHKINKDANYSLFNYKNYKKDFSCEINIITHKYCELLIEYFKFITENVKIKNEKLTKFIIVRGLDTITHVFLIILFYTKNIDITYFHCQKSFYFYVEFVCQISEDDKKFLQLTTRDATLYVYKKTIFEINNDCKKMNDSLAVDTIEKTRIINIYINIYKTYMQKIIEQDTQNKMKYIDIFQKITHKLNMHLNNIPNHSSFEKITDKLSNNIGDIDTFFVVNQEIIKKTIKMPQVLNIIQKNLSHELFNCKIHDKTEKFILWLTTNNT